MILFAHSQMISVDVMNTDSFISRRLNDFKFSYLTRVIQYYLIRLHSNEWFQIEKRVKHFWIHGSDANRSLVLGDSGGFLPPQQRCSLCVLPPPR